MSGFHDRSWCYVLLTVLVGACSASGDASDGRRSMPLGTAGTGSPSMSAGTAGTGSQSNTAGSPTLPDPVSNPPAVAGASGANPMQPPRRQDDKSCATISQQAKNQRKPADIIFAVDNSPSMNDEITFVRERLNAFSEQIVQSGIDVHIIMISASLVPRDTDDEIEESVDEDDNGICIDAPLGSGMCPLDSNAPRYFHVSKQVGSGNALNLFISEFPNYQAQLRQNATKTFVVVTDDDADSRPNDSAAAFQQGVANLPGGAFPAWSFSGIYCFSDCRDAASVGVVYGDLVRLTQGVAGDLCEQDFAPVFDKLAKAVITASGLDCAWDIPAPPAGQTFDRKRVNVQYSAQGAAASGLLQVSNQGACGTRSGWYYDDVNDPKRIHACPSTCDTLQTALDAKVEVLFGCETMVAPD